MNSAGERDSDMYRTKKGNQCYFRLKAHVGVGAKTGTVHALVATHASVANLTVLRCEERKVWGDGGCQGQSAAIREDAPNAQDKTCRRTRFKYYLDELQKKKNRNKSSVRGKAEPVFRIVKYFFGFDKMRYHGLAKNHRQCANFTLASLYQHRKRLGRLG